jgi:GNAT superfamily N-acetyltransferase
MLRLREEQFELARPLFTALIEFNLSLEAVLAGSAPGEVYVDNAIHPQVGFAITSEGHYLSGDPDRELSYSGLREVIPAHAHLIFHPESWEGKLDQVWANKVARRHPRQHLRYRPSRLPDVDDNIADGFQLVRVDRALLDRKELGNHDGVAGWVGDWHSPEYFLEHGFGFCLLYGDQIASWCLTDCVLGNQCEIGIVTDRDYRRRGLATIAVKAAIDHCIKHGFDQIGWHCLSSNAGSIAVAKRNSFVKERDYFAYSSALPAENARDLPAAEYADWAEHYERFIKDDAGWALRAAEAWAMAGYPERALADLQRLIDCDWNGQPEWLDRNWRLDSLRGAKEFKTLRAILHPGK